MNHRRRRWLFYSFVVIFLILASYTSLYATGYKINFQNIGDFDRLFIKTGTLVLNSQPSGAFVYLNDKLQGSFSLQKLKSSTIITPAKIKNITPGEYNLRLEKEGYWPFEKKVIIFPEQTSYEENINLFKKEAIMKILNCGCQEISMSPNRRYVLLKSSEQIIDLKNKRPIEVGKIKEENQEQWLSNGYEILIDQKIFNLNNGTSIDYGEIIGDDINQLYLEENSKRLFYRYNNSLNIFDLNKKSNEKIINEEHVSDYLVNEPNVFILITKNNSTTLKKLNLKTKEAKEIELPIGGQYQFNRATTTWLSVEETKNQKLLFLETDRLRLLSEEISNFRSGFWLSADKFIYHNDFEIYLLDLKQNNISLINRISEKIQNIAWQEKNNYLIYTTDLSINTIDLKDLNITKLLSASQISSPFFDQKEKILYFSANLNNQSGLYKMVIQ